MPAPLASISVDLDSLPHYCRIHGLDEGLLDAGARRLVYTHALPRFLALLGELGLSATFFAVGEDLADAQAAAALARAHAAGHEVANHSLSHDYALSRLAPQRLEREVAGGEEAIARAVGHRPVGFRAPGYTLSAALYAALERRGYAYDSSTFPAAPYWAAKAAVMGALALAGRPSRAVLDSPRVLLAPLEPYWPHPAAPYARGAGRVLELPMAVSPLVRFPFIGTFAVALPAPVVQGLYRATRRRRFFNFELHGVDLLEAADGIPAALVRRQRDLGVALARKRERLRALFGRLAAEREVVTLERAAARLRAAAGAPPGPFFPRSGRALV